MEAQQLLSRIEIMSNSSMTYFVDLISTSLYNKSTVIAITYFVTNFAVSILAHILVNYRN